MAPRHNDFMRRSSSLSDSFSRVGSGFSPDTIFGGDTGYVRHSSLGTGTAFTDIFGMDTAPEPDQQIVLTDIMPQTKFEVPTIKAPDTVKKYEGGNIEVTDKAPGLRQDVQAVETSYMAADQQAKTMVIEAMKEVAPDRADVIAGHIFPRDQAPLIVDMFRPMINTGTAGNIYEVLNSIKNEKQAPNKGEIREVLEKTLHQLHEHSKRETQQFAEGKKPHPPQFDFTQIQTPKQLLEFIQRDPMKDPVMQQIQDAHVGVDAIAENEQAAREVVAEQNETRAQFSAAGITLTTAALTELPRVTPASLELDSEAVEAIKKSKAPEPKNDIDPPVLAKAAAPGALAGAAG